MQNQIRTVCGLNLQEKAANVSPELRRSSA